MSDKWATIVTCPEKVPRFAELLLEATTRCPCEMCGCPVASTLSRAQGQPCCLDTATRNEHAKTHGPSRSPPHLPFACCRPFCPLPRPSRPPRPQLPERPHRAPAPTRKNCSGFADGACSATPHLSRCRRRGRGCSSSSARSTCLSLHGRASCSCKFDPSAPPAASVYLFRP